jgi:hypothetical protein
MATLRTGLKMVRGQIATSPGNGEIEGETPVGAHGGDLQVAVEALDVGAPLDVAGQQLTGAGALEPHCDGLLALTGEDHVLEVQDQIGDVLHDTGDGVELVEGVVETHLGDRCARDRRQQRAAQRVPNGVPEPWFEGTDREALTVVVFVAEGLDRRALHDEHAHCLLQLRILGATCCTAR